MSLPIGSQIASMTHTPDAYSLYMTQIDSFLDSLENPLDRQHDNKLLLTLA